MYYADGSVYEGEWYNDLRNGEGMLRLGKVEMVNINFLFKSEKISVLSLHVQCQVGKKAVKLLYSVFVYI